MFTDYSENSRVWVYQSSRPFTKEENTILQAEIDAFVDDWSAHKLQLKSAAQIIYNQFIVFMVDENQHEASGCSIDKSVKFIKELEQKYTLNLMDRMQTAYRDANNNIAVSHLNSLSELAEQQQINSTTIVFNNLVTTKKEFASNWEIELKNSWHKNYIPQLV